MKKTIAFLFAVCTFSFIWLSFAPGATNGAWVVPDAYKTKKNPVASNAASIANGKSLYTLHCASCHGKKGKGDGSKAAQLETDCGDFSTAAFHAQSDGSIFYKTVEGRDDMPSFKKKIPDQEDVWSVVNYIRTLKL